MLEGPLAEAHPGEHLDGVGGAAVDLDEDHEALRGPARLLEPHGRAAGQRHADAQHLAGTEVSVEAHRFIRRP